MICPALKGASRKNARAAAAVIFLLAAGGANAQFTVAPGSPLAVGTAPKSMAADDFNGDGKPDIAIANSNGNNVTILLGNGAGGFAAAVGSPVAVGARPRCVAAGDFNGDGKLDLVTANFGDNTITILLGDGTGRFVAAPGSPFAVGSSPVFVAVGDFNGDGKTDIATANSGDNTVTVLLGNGAGRFTAAGASPFLVGATPQSVAVGDLNADGAQDIVAANYSDGDVTVLLGDGSGGFAPSAGSPFPVGATPVQAVLADLNGDGIPDIVTANSGDMTVSELLGDGAGGFTPASPVLVGSKPDSVAVADFNGDGNPDIVTANFNDNTLTVLLANGMGGFSPSAGSPFAVGSMPSFVAVADFNRDGKPDLAVANSGTNNITVFLNGLPSLTVTSAALTFYAGVGLGAPAAIPVTVSSSTSGSTYTATSNRPWLMPSPASNATGGTSTVTLSASAASLTAGVHTGTVRYTAPSFFDSSTGVTLRVSAASGTLQAATGSPFPVGASPQSIAAGDFNGDGKLDLVTANYSAGTVTILLGDGSGGFAAAGGSPFAVGIHPTSIAVADFNGDGKLDIVTANSGGNNVTILLGNGAGAFAAAAGSPFAVGTEPLSVAVADLNGDGKPDIVTANNGSKDLTVLLGNGTGGFTAAAGSPFPLGASPQSVAVGDFNSDGKPDLVTVDGNYATVSMGNGLGGFTTSGIFPVGVFPQSVAMADLNGDGKPDIVTVNTGDNTVTVLLGDGVGGFTTAAGSPITVGSSPLAVLVLDIGGDGKPDIVTSNASDNTVTVLIGDGAGGFIAAPGSPFPAGMTPFAIAAGDFNGDGRTDLAVTGVGSDTVAVLVGTASATGSLLSTTAAATVAYGTPVPLTLNVAGGFSASRGTGTFQDGGMSIGAAAQTTSPYTFAATGLTAGSHTLTATYGGDSGNLTSSSNSVSVTVMPQNQTIVFGALLTMVLGPAPIILSATASSGLPVSFVATTPSVCSVSVSSLTLLSIGTCTIQASQAGDMNYQIAAPVNQSFQVTRGSQTIAFTAPPNVMIGTGPVALSAMATSGLIVSFASTSPSICTVSGATATLVSVGLCKILATQAGNVNYTAAVPVSQSFSVTTGSETIVFAALPDQAFGTAPFRLNATATSGLAVTFTSTAKTVCTVAGTTVTLVSLGGCTIQASQAGNSNFAAAPPVSQTFTVTPGNQTINVGSPKSLTFGTPPFAVKATATSGLPVSFQAATPSICTVAGATVTVLGVGVCEVEADQAGNANYNAAMPVDQFFVVMQGTQTITFGVLKAVKFGPAPITVTATSSSGLPVTFTAATAAICSVSGTAVSLAGVGKCTVQAAQSGTSNYAAATSVSQSFVVSVGSQTIVFGTIADQAFGTAPFALTAAATSTLPLSLTAAPAAVCTLAGATVTLVGLGVCTINASQAGDTNYAAALSVSQSFKVKQGSQTIAFAAIANQTLDTAQFPVSAKASSGLPVSFAASPASVCTVSGATVSLVSVGMCTIQASQAGDANYSAAKPVAVTFTVGPGATSIVIGAVTNAASYATSELAAGSCAVAFGTNFSTTTGQATSFTLPTTLAGAVLTITDAMGGAKTASLFYASPNQINFLVPEGLASGAATLSVTNAAGSTGTLALKIAQIAPGLFSADSSGKGAPAAFALVYPSGGSLQSLPAFTCAGSPVVCMPAPIDLGPPSTVVYLELFGTGISGRAALSDVTVTLGGTNLKVVYASAQGTYAGLDQLNVLVDRSLIGKGALTLKLTVAGQAANPVTVDIK